MTNNDVFQERKTLNMHGFQGQLGINQYVSLLVTTSLHDLRNYVSLRANPTARALTANAWH